MPESSRIHAGVVGLFLVAAAARADVGDAIRRGNDALRGGDVERALQLYSAGSVDAPDSPDLAYNRGVAVLQAGDAASAARYFEAAAALAEGQGRPDLAARAHYNRGVALAQDPAGEAGAPAPAPPGLTILPDPDAPAAAPSPARPAPPPGAAGMPGAPGPDLKGALGAFKRAIELAPEDLDAKYNYVQVQRRLEAQKPPPQQQKKDGEDGEDGEENQDQQQDQKRQDDQESKQQQDQEDQQDQKDQKDQQQGGQGDEGQQRQQPPPRPGEEEPPDDATTERLLDALENEEKERLKESLRARQARPRRLSHDW